MRTRKRAERAGEVMTTDDLTLGQMFELAIGPGPESEFASDEHRRREWLRHRTVLMAEVNPGTRPWGWWVYESPDGEHPEWAIPDRKKWPEPWSSENVRLHELGQLTADEMRALGLESKGET